MRQKVAVRLSTPAHEMAQEEMKKQIAFLSREITDIQFVEAGAVLEFEAPQELSSGLHASGTKLAEEIQQSIGLIARNVIYRSKTSTRPTFKGTGVVEGAHFETQGVVALEGLAQRLHRYFDRAFEEFAAPWKPALFIPPTLIPTTVLAKCDYFRSFPHNLTFGCHLPEDFNRIDDFRRRHEGRSDLDDQAISDMVKPEVCLSPAVCYHVYAANHDKVVPAAGRIYGAVGKCFRFESTNMRDLRRLWDFTLREVIFIGGREFVLKERQRGIERFSDFLETHQLAAEIRTASDPFFVAPDAAAKTAFQLGSSTKYEISAMLPDDERLAVGSFNYHHNFFGAAFNVQIENGQGPMHSVCIGFGLERWVYAFLVQHGDNPATWPKIVRKGIKD